MLIWFRRLLKRLFRRRHKMIGSAPKQQALGSAPKQQAHRRSRYRGISRKEFTFTTPCALVEPPSHTVTVLIVDNVVRQIATPCDLRVGAATHMLSHAPTCAEPCTEIKRRLAGHGSLPDPLSGNLFEAVGKADRKRIARKPAPRPTKFRYSPSVWAALLAKTSSLPVRVSTSRFGHSVWVETPIAHSEYTFTGGMWALALGPGDPAVYRLLSKYLCPVLDDQTVVHMRWEPQVTFMGDAAWPYGEEPPPRDTKR
jgi:hypothetical protein